VGAAADALHRFGASRFGQPDGDDGRRRSRVGRDKEE
jgi:hypothetical protein